MTGEQGETNIYKVIEMETQKELILSIKQDVNRPNDPSDDDLIYKYMEDNYGWGPEYAVADERIVIVEI